MNANILEAIAVTAELTGSSFTPAAARAFAMDLAPYPEGQVLKALERARKELRPGQMTPEAIINRLPDGRPGVEEAWAKLPRSEDETVVWTDETQTAWGGCKQLLNSGDFVAARMAFKEQYVALVRDRRMEAEPVKWLVSLGRDRDKRGVALARAAHEGKITRELALEYCPFMDFTTGADGAVTALLANPQIPPKARASLMEFVEKSKKAKADKRAVLDEQIERRHATSFGDPEWCKAHGVRYDERA